MKLADMTEVEYGQLFRHVETGARAKVHYVQYSSDPIQGPRRTIMLHFAGNPRTDPIKPFECTVAGTTESPMYEVLPLEVERPADWELVDSRV